MTLATPPIPDAALAATSVSATTLLDVLAEIVRTSLPSRTSERRIGGCNRHRLQPSRSSTAKLSAPSQGHGTPVVLRCPVDGVG